MAVPKSFPHKGKMISFRDTGSGYEIFVNGNSSGLKRWESSSTTYSNLNGQKISSISDKGFGIIEALEVMGKIWLLFFRGRFYLPLFNCIFSLCLYN